MRKQVKKMEISQHAKYSERCFILVSAWRADTTQHARSAARTQSSGTQSASGRARRARKRWLAAPGRCREYPLPPTRACVYNGQDARGSGHTVDDSSFARDCGGIGHGLQDGNWSFAARVRMSATAIRIDSVREMRFGWTSRPLCPGSIRFDSTLGFDL